MYRKLLCGMKCIFILIFASACVGFPFADFFNSDTETESNRQTSAGTDAAPQPRTSGADAAPQPKTAGARTAPQPLFTGNGGKGLVIAVPAPSMQGGSQSDSWMPQLLQDLITADLARYSAMTVLDRINESLVRAEQNLSASGDYSDDDYIAIGRLTNARYIVAGNIRSVSGRYSITFRINNTETNEIQASFSRQYVLEDIESGRAAKEAVRELLAGMGVELSAEGERQLLALAVEERTVKSQVRLAQGMSAERNNNELQALIYFYEARNADQGNREASQRIQTFGQGSPGASIRERAQWAITQKTRWEKIFNDLTDYVYENLRIVVYDFSTISDQFDARTNKVTLTVTPGVKLIVDSTVLTVWKTVIDQWEQIKNLEENKSWANSLSLRRRGTMGDVRYALQTYSPSANIELYDEAGIRIANSSQHLNSKASIGDIRYDRNLQILPQSRYFSTTPFVTVSFSVPLDNITDNMSAKVVNIRYFAEVYPARIMSVQEWNEWLASR